MRARSKYSGRSLSPMTFGKHSVSLIALAYFRSAGVRTTSARQRCDRRHVTGRPGPRNPDAEIRSSPAKMLNCGLHPGSAARHHRIAPRFWPSFQPSPDRRPSNRIPFTWSGSITKTVTATALMILVERGKVSLNEPVSTYLPEFKGGEKDRVRVINLLTHTFRTFRTSCRRTTSCAKPMRR